MQRDLRAGTSPFWLDGFFMGHPLAFTQEAPVFYPPTVPLLLTGAPVHRLADVFSLLHLGLAGLGGFLLVRFLTGAAVSSLFGGLAYMLSARTLQSVMWPNAVSVAALLPFLLLGIARIAESRSRKGLILASLAGGLALLSARPHSLLGAAPTLLAFAGVQLAGARDRRRCLADLALAAGLALAIGAPSLLPTAMAFPETSRFGGLSVDARNVGALSRPELDQVFLPSDGLARWTEAASYPGAVTFALFLAGVAFVFLRPRRFPRALFLAFAAAAVAGFVFAFGDAGPYRVLSSWPLIRGFRTPVRYLACFGLALAFGSALALAALESTVRRGRALAGGAVALLAVDLGIHTVRAAPTVPAETYRVRPLLADHLARLPRDPLGFPPRFWSFGYFPPLHVLRDGGRALAARGDTLAFAAGARFGLDAVQGAGPPLARTQEAIESRALRIAQLSGASRIVVRGTSDLAGDSDAPPVPGGRVVRTPEPFPRAILVGETVVVPSGHALDRLLEPSFDPSRAAILEEGASWAAPGRDRSGTVTLVGRRPSEVVFRTSAASELLLVFFDAFSEGWAVTVDGASRSLLRADVCFRAVRLDAGTHRVVFSYRAPGVRDGLLIGLLGLVLLGVMARRIGPEPPAGALPRT